MLKCSGYMAPEYFMSRIVTTKADIYSLGVIIMEIITGSKVNIFSFSSRTSCKHFVKRVRINELCLQIHHCWRMSHWYQHVSAGQNGAGTNVPVQYKAGTLVPASNPSRH